MISTISGIYDVMNAFEMLEDAGLVGAPPFKIEIVGMKAGTPSTRTQPAAASWAVESVRTFCAWSVSYQAGTQRHDDDSANT